MLERYLVFGGDFYYPAGGWADCLGSYGSVDAAKLAAEAANVLWAHIVDGNIGSIILKGSSKGTWITIQEWIDVGESESIEGQ
jgi:hypothetical protein